MEQNMPSDLLIECLITKKEEQHLTNAVIAEKSGVPESTVTKLFNRTIKSPTFDTVAPIARTLNVSLDALLGMEGAEPPSVPVAQSVDSKMFAMLIDSYTQQLLVKNRWITVLSAALFAVFVMLIVFVIYDISHPTLGWVQYTVYAKSAIRNFVDCFRL